MIRKLSVNGSVQFLGLYDQAWGGGLPYISNLLAQVESTGWGSSNNYNKNWGRRFKDVNRITNIDWGASISASPTKFTMSPECPCAARRRIHGNLFHCTHNELLWSQFNFRNPLENHWVCWRGKARYGTVTQ